MENQTTYRIRTKLGETEPINIPVKLMQEYNSFEILSLKINTNDTYRSYTSTEGIVVGRVSTANNGLGIPNVRVSIFVPKGAYTQSDEEAVLYPFSAPTDMDGDRVRYNLLPSDSDVDCYQVIGTLPTKRKILDNETVCEVFDKFYKYTTVTNEAGDFMLSNIPVGKQRIHIDADLSDIGPFLSQKPYDMIENLGFEKNRFESTRQFKTSKDLDSLAQVITQNKSVYVYPYWGDSTENSAEMKITRTDLSLNYEFKTGAIFIGSVITDKQSNSIRQNCTATENAGKMSDMVTGPGRIEMIRKTIDDKVEQYRIKGDELINDNGVWCYTIPMNLDYVRTDEFGNIVPTDDPNKGVPTRARVRFRITLNEMESDEDAHKRCSYLVPNNPKYDDIKFLQENTADYSFGSDTWDESFVDLFWNKVYTVKNYVPRIQKTVKPTNRKHTGIKMVNHFGDNNPFPYNSISIKLSFLYRLICVIVHIFIDLVKLLNIVISTIGAPFCWLATVKIGPWRPFKKVLDWIPSCIPLSSEFCDDGINKNVTYPGCGEIFDCVWNKKTKPECDKKQYEVSEKSGEAAVCTNSDTQLFTCVENQLAQQNEATSFNFGNDWINGCLYMPLWYRKIRPKKSFFFGLFKRSAKDQWCAGESNNSERQLKMASFCSHSNSKEVETLNYTGEKITHNITGSRDGCGDKCHEVINWVKLSNGLIMNRENMFGQKVWYYKATEVESSLSSGFANEYENYTFQPMVSKTLYATDIVLLGSMNDCDMNGIPKFFNYLKGSTYNMPTDILFTDTEIEYKFNEKNEFVGQDSHKISVSSGCDWGNPNEYGYRDGGLFYSIGCSTILVDTASCVNLKRICELGVGQDEMQYIDNIDVKNETGIGAVSITNENDSLDYNNLDYYLRPDGFISYDDINDFNYRSMFATMNGNNLKTKINTTNGVKEYDFRHLYIDNFDGSLYELMKDEQSRRGKANYKHNYLLETTNADYLTFRMGDRPYYYDGKSLVQSNKNAGSKKYTLPKYQNSFYFYFGLKEGKTAIDLFNEQYNGPCLTKGEEKETIPYEKKANGWCSVDSDDNGTFNHESYDGYLKIDFENLPLPCSVFLNSRDNNAVTYTISTLDGDGDMNVADEKICFYGSNTSDVDRNMAGYVRYCFHYENPSYDNPVDVKKCYMLNNGEYDMFVTDGEGNQHSFIISIKSEYLQFDDVERKFGQPNNVLLKYYKTANATGSAIPYHSVSQSPDPSTEKITIAPDLSGVPYVTREDYAMKYVEGTAILDVNTKNYVKLNGTICLYNVFFDNKPLDKFIIEVEPYEKERVDGEDYYVDKDFWSDSNGKQTWYSVKMFNDHEKDIVCKDYSVTDGEDGRKIVTPSKDDTNYFYYEDMTVNETLKVRCYVIKCPKGDVNYRVRVTQLCEKDGVYYKSQNYIERKIFVSQPTPYKLLINDADYDIIKNFKTGWNLREKEPLQNGENLLGSKDFRPFTGVGNFNDIQGWLTISDINNNYAWGEEPEKYGTEDVKFEKYNGDIEEYKGMYDLEVKLRLKEDAEPKEPQRSNYDDDSKYGEDYTRWLRLHDEWENGCFDDNGERSVNYNNINDESGCCGYKYLKEAAQILLNRLDFVEKMKSSFWIQCENSDKTISYSVRTDDTPYDVWTIYNPEYESPNDNDYHETDSEVKDRKEKRHYWKCIGESTQYINGIKIPNITAYNSKDFGIYEDSVRQNPKGIYKYTYNSDKTMCFGQDNIAENSIDSGSISIKPPYLVACVNYEGMTKPNNLKKEKFYSQDSANKYGIEPYRFGDVGDNAKWIKDGDYEFFQFYLIDKIFSPDIVTWAYMSNIPYFLPWYEYDTKPQDRNPDSAGNNLGYVIKTSGIVSGFIKNGITSDNGYINDFEQRSIFDKETVIKTYKGDTEDSIPTRRCILYQDEKGEEKPEVYLNYRHTDEVDDSNQFKSVPNREGELNFVDKGGNCETTRTLYGAMKVVLKSTTLNDPLIKSTEFFGHKFSTSVGENGDTSLTLKVGVSNSDTESPITYYIFEASMKGDIPEGEPYKTRRLWYPLNAFYAYTSETPYRYEIEWPDKGDKKIDINVPWDGSTKLAPQMFSKNTLEKHFKDKYNLDSDLVQESAKSTVVWENEEGAVMTEETDGYGNTGIFTNLSHKPYFVIAVTENNCRAISPVYDFHTVYYVVGLVVENGQKILRSALVYVLKKYNTDDKPDNDGYDPNLTGLYCKKPRNYYLTQFDFTISYTFAYGSTLVTNDGITYEKTNVNFKDGTSFDENDPVGTSYVVENADGSFTIHTKNGGAMVEGQETTEVPAGEELPQGEYWYETIIVENNTETGGTEETRGWVTVTVDANGNISESEPSKKEPELTQTQLPESGYITITVTDAEPGAPTEVYKPISYSTETVTTIQYDPRTPYFMRYNDKSLTDDEFESMKLLLTMSTSEFEKNVKYYVTDVTGLKHKCKLHKIIKKTRDWKTQVLNYPK